MSIQWRSRRELGSAGAIRLIVWLALHAGRGICRVLLVPICIYFLVTAPLPRRASQEFLGRALGRHVKWRDTLRHLLVFSTTLLDRVYLLHGRQHELAIEVTNEAAFWNALATGRGCLLLGSHLGSFQMLGVIGSLEKKLAINMVMHVDGDARLGGLVLGDQEALPYNVIPLGEPGSMIKVKECLDRGEVVGILADRVYSNEATQSLPFFGRMARFSLSPLRLARITGAPVVTVFGLFQGGNRYEIVFESLAPRVVDSSDGPRATFDATTAPPATRENAVSLQSCLTSYVASLEHHARRCPFNWFNFYDFWSH